MDIDKFIDDNLNNIAEIYLNTDNLNESIDILKNDDYKDNEDNDIDEDNNNKDDISYYYLNLLNIFMKYYNDKYNKNNNFFSDMIDMTKDTSSVMELFFESIVEYKQLKNILNEESDDIIMKIYFDNNNKKKFNDFLEIYDGQVYKLEINDSMIYSPSLLICLNYILDNYDYLNNTWAIYNLRIL